jgi:serine/threonine protein kinase
LHRDIKPDNIIRRKSDGQYILVDFGACRLYDTELDHGQGTNIGTKGYSAGEQLRAEPKPASDLYSLGVTCIRLLTGCFWEPPDRDELFDDNSSTWKWLDVLKKQGSQVSEQLAKVLDKMIEGLLFNRYDNATEVLSDLDIYTFETVKLDEFGNIIVRELCTSRSLCFNLGHDIVLEMIYIPEGQLIIESENISINLPAFYMGKYPVTQEQYYVISGENPSHFSGDNRPVENISWYDTEDFCNKLNNYTGEKFRLPNVIEWEYSCRAGTTTRFTYGNKITSDLANFDGRYIRNNISKSQYREETTPVGIFPPNQFGLHDVHGNVWEWCESNSFEDKKILENSINKLGKELKGGSWDDKPNDCTCTKKISLSPNSYGKAFGFRVLLPIV